MVGNRRVGASWWAQLLPWVLLFGGVGVNLLTPPTLAVTPIFSASPLVASALLSFRATVLNAVGTVVAISAMLVLRAPQEAPDERVYKIITVVTVAGLAVLINVVLSRRERQLSSARNTAEVVQRALVPQPPAQAHGLAIAHRYRAAARDEWVGGDFYAVVDSPYGTRALLGDVRGKGLEATESASVVLGAFRESAEYVPDLSTLTGRLDAALVRHARESSALDEAEKFVTAVVVQLTGDEPGEGLSLRVVNSGHPPPLLLTPDHEIRVLEPATPTLPLGMELSDGRAAPIDHLTLPPGGTLLLYTDGMSEARDRGGRFYDPVVRLGGRPFADPDELLDWLVADILRHAGGNDDDLALLALRCTGGAHRPAGDAGLADGAPPGDGASPGEGAPPGDEAPPGEGASRSDGA